MANKPNTAHYLTDDDVKTIQEFIDKNVVDKPMTGQDILNAVKDKLTSEYSFSSLSSALNQCVALGYIVGVEGRRRVGYVPCERIEPIKRGEAPEPKRKGKKPNPIHEIDIDRLSKSCKKTNETLTSKPILSWPKKDFGHAKHVWIGQTMYRVMCPFARLEKVIISTLNGRKEEDGPIAFNGECWTCSDVDMFEKILVNVLFAELQQKSSEPVLNDESGIPVELRVA